MPTMNDGMHQWERSSNRAEKEDLNSIPADLVENFDNALAEARRDEFTTAAKVETKLRAIYPCEVVKAKDGIFTVDVEGPVLRKAQLVEKYNSAARKIPGVKGIRVHVLSTIGGLG